MSGKVSGSEDWFGFLVPWNGWHRSGVYKTASISSIRRIFDTPHLIVHPWAYFPPSQMRIDKTHDACIHWRLEWCHCQIFDHLKRNCVPNQENSYQGSVIWQARWCDLADGYESRKAILGDVDCSLELMVHSRPVVLRSAKSILLWRCSPPFARCDVVDCESFITLNVSLESTASWFFAFDRLMVMDYIMGFVFSALFAVTELPFLPTRFTMSASYRWTRSLFDESKWEPPNLKKQLRFNYHLLPVRLARSFAPFRAARNSPAALDACILSARMQIITGQMLLLLGSFHLERVNLTS